MKVQSKKQKVGKGGIVMPLTMLRSGEAASIRRIGGKDGSKRFLENLGFIVQVKDSRVAVSKGIANKIMV